jgi:hypothetical protein
MRQQLKKNSFPALIKGKTIPADSKKKGKQGEPYLFESFFWGYNNCKIKKISSEYQKKSHVSM